MIGELMLVVGVGLVSVALRSFARPVWFRLGTLGLVLTSFLAGWRVGGSLWLGVVLALSWFFLPWLEILTRVRRLRLPAERTLAPRRPPTRDAFPAFGDLTDEIEAEGFEFLEDTGWQHDDTRHFYRVFFHPDHRTEASICLAEQRDFAFYYVSVTSRTVDGRTFMTWNYPFSYGLKVPPTLRVHRCAGAGPFREILETHGDFLAAERIETPMLAGHTGEEILDAMQREMRSQISHNLDLGLLARADGNMIRYTARGMFYLWWQFLRDFVRIT